ncbi:hypothetical protein D499_0C00980 [Hanseniaspora uvarum DSM 2768]|nr:hypothetical protein D499_0C00980 [Hanseniaspora uvarum DSM 2768]
MKEEVIQFHLPFVSSIILGNLSRLGLLKINDSYTNSYTTNSTILYANFLACIIMGFLQVFNFSGHDSNLQVCLTTGYCGTFSSFSTYIYEIFIHTVLKAHLFSNYGATVSEFFIVNIVELCVSMGGLKLGLEIGNIVKSSLENKNKEERIGMNLYQEVIEKAGNFLKHALSILSVPLVITMLVLSIVYRHKYHSYWTLSSLFSIFGAYTRYYLSKLNGKLKNKWNFFPIGTYIANFVASTLLSILLLLFQRYNNNFTKKLVLYSLIEGFTASMSTMSTLMNEMNKLSLFKSSAYIFISVISSYAMFIIILGSYKWTHNLNAL